MKSSLRDCSQWWEDLLKKGVFKLRRKEAGDDESSIWKAIPDDRRSFTEKPTCKRRPWVLEEEPTSSVTQMYLWSAVLKLIRQVYQAYITPGLEMLAAQLHIRVARLSQASEACSSAINHYFMIDSWRVTSCVIILFRSPRTGYNTHSRVLDTLCNFYIVFARWRRAPVIVFAMDTAT